MAFHQYFYSISELFYFYSFGFFLVCSVKYKANFLSGWLLSFLLLFIEQFIFPHLFEILLFFFKYFIYSFIFWLRWVFIAVCGLSLVAASGGYSLLWCEGFSLQWLLLLQSTGSRHVGFSSCGTRTQYLWLAGSRAQNQQLWRMGLVALQHIGSSRTRDRTRVPCIGRRILNHCTTMEAPRYCF